MSADLELTKPDQEAQEAIFGPDVVDEEPAQPRSEPVDQLFVVTIRDGSAVAWSSASRAFVVDGEDGSEVEFYGTKTDYVDVDTLHRACSEVVKDIVVQQTAQAVVQQQAQYAAEMQARLASAKAGGLHIPR